MSEIVEFKKPVSPVSVTVAEPTPATRLEVPLSVRSIVARDLFVRVSVSAQVKSQATWFAVPAALGRVELKAGQELAIPVTVDIPAGTPTDRHGFKVLVADDDAAEIDFSESPVVTIERKAKVVDHSWWKWVALGVGVAATLAIVLLLAIPSGTALGGECDPSKPACRDGGVCPAEISRCVAPSGITCDDNKQCLSNKCEERKCAPALLGDVCYPARKDCEGDSGGCHKQKKLCVSFQNGPCRTREDCVEGACTKTGAALMCGKPIGQAGCENDEQCPGNQVCSKVAGGSICLYRGGVLCPAAAGNEGGRFACASQICNIRGRCAPQDNSCVPADQDCDSGEQCVNNQCQRPSGSGPPLRASLAELLRSATIVNTNRNFELRERALATPGVRTK